MRLAVALLLVGAALVFAPLPVSGCLLFEQPAVTAVTWTGIAHEGDLLVWVDPFGVGNETFEAIAPAFVTVTPAKQTIQVSDHSPQLLTFHLKIAANVSNPSWAIQFQAGSASLCCAYFDEGSGGPAWIARATTPLFYPGVSPHSPAAPPRLWVPGEASRLFGSPPVARPLSYTGAAPPPGDPFFTPQATIEFAYEPTLPTFHTSRVVASPAHMLYAIQKSEKCGASDPMPLVLTQGGTWNATLNVYDYGIQSIEVTLLAAQEYASRSGVVPGTWHAVRCDAWEVALDWEGGPLGERQPCSADIPLPLPTSHAAPGLLAVIPLAAALLLRRRH